MKTEAKSGNLASVELIGERWQKVNTVFGFDYGDDIPKARPIMAGVLERDDRILKEQGSDDRTSGTGGKLRELCDQTWVKTSGLLAVCCDRWKRQAGL